MGRLQKRYIPWDWKPNTPIKSLIRDFEDEESGRVVKARKEIWDRFEFLDWKDQKRFLHLCLDSCATDRQWAYGKLRRMWDKSFEEKVRHLWEDMHDPHSQWPIIEHFPVEYIMEHENDFTEERDYYFICLRLVVEVQGFQIDKDRLTPLQYLKVLSRGKRELSEEEAYDVLSRIVPQTSMNAITSRYILDELYKAIKYVRDLGQYGVASDFQNLMGWSEPERHGYEDYYEGTPF